eukprot:TRINITY_DN6515_c1_g1_i1.p1 TRINITY_DN6515_c1_g1~~TRINITY_DN6515_c1_g1_i1.p1  ORF type:complete len:1158 (+),score=438.75 TRINITY_DN6515_c1_g1_i1:68-3541(+)
MDYQRQVAKVGVDDLVLLPELNEKAITTNMQDRLQKEQIYTYIGPVLISVNPFKRIHDMYSEQKMQYYRRNARTSTVPHIFALAANIFSNMLSEEENQCVIISGESGAGKTEASKQIMSYIAHVAGKGADMDRVKKAMMDSNPVLEAFGNAKTVRNDNSSRFGKFMELYFDAHGGPSGGTVRNFLLEKSRVTYQGKGDRNYHIFYQLCCGADDALRRRLHLKSPAEHAITSAGGVLERPGVSDAEEFRETCRAMDALGVQPKDREALFRLLAAILNLGDVKFENKGEYCVVRDKTPLENAADLLEVDDAILDRGLTWKTVEAGGEMIDVQLDFQQCKEVRDALCKGIYSKVFDFVVAEVNRAFDTRSKHLMIGILDIYGFEIFEKNGFEQFCINYVNEKLQQIFIDLTLKVEQEEYVKEKIKWETIKYFNNKIVCDLIEETRPKPGLFALLDDVCAKMHKERADVADIKMLETFDQGVSGHLHYKRMGQGFSIRHYAGDVQYAAEGFTTKNKDILPKDLLKVIASSDCGLLRRFYAEESEILDEAAKGSPKAKRQTTAGKKIREQAADLIATLKKCTPHYIRTVKPNDNREPLGFVFDRVNHQVKYLGLLENVRVRRAGFSYRQHFDKFLKRFKYVNPATYPRPFRGDDRTACQTVLSQIQHQNFPQGCWQLGDTKVFIRQPGHLFHLEDLREQAFGKIAAKVQKGWKVYKGGREMLHVKQDIERNMKQYNKKRRAGSVFRTWKGDYMEFHDELKWRNVHTIVKHVPPSGWQPVDAGRGDGSVYYYNSITQASQWEKPAEMDPPEPKILYTERVIRITNHAQATQGYEYMVVTDQYIYLVEDQHELITPPPVEKPTKKNPNPPPIYPPFYITHTVLKKKLPIQYIKGLSMSLQADGFLVMHFYEWPDQVLWRPPAPPKPEKPPKAKAKPARPVRGKKGKAAAAAAAVEEPPPAWEPPQPRVDVDPHEPVEDIILISQYKTEICGVIRMAYKKLMQQDMPVAFSDTIDYMNKTEQKKQVAAMRQLLCYENWQMLDAAVYVQSETQLVAHCPSGLEYDRVAQVDRERETRRSAARERFMREQAEAKKREEELERQREEERKRQVEARKREKEEEEKRIREEEEERERKRAERKARAAKIVAEKADKPDGGAPDWMKKKK